MAKDISLEDKADPLNTESTMRSQLNVNSPKAKKTFNWSPQGGPQAPTHAVTQMGEGDEKRQKEIAAKMAEKLESEKSGCHSESTPLASTRRPANDRCSCCSQRSCFRCFFNKNSLNAVDVVNMDEHRVASNIEVLQDVDVNPAGEPGATENIEEAHTEMQEREVSESEGLLGPRDPADIGRKCLVLDLDETLVHSSFQPVNCSFCVPIVLDSVQHDVYVMKRPFVDEFLAECAKTFELIIFTASLSEYANPVIDKLDTAGVIKHRLFRESCVLHEGQAYVKDLSRLGRKLKDCIIIDNSPLSYLFDPQNAIGCTTWFGDPTDTELRDLLPVLNGVLSTTADVRQLLSAHEQSVSWLISQYGENKNSDSIAGSEEDVTKLVNKTGTPMLN